MTFPVLRALSAGLALSAALLSVASALPDQAVPESRADEKRTLPLAPSFSKGEPGENGGPYVLTLKNTSQAAVTVTATVLQSVVSHNRPKTFDVGPKTIEAGGSWAIPDLAVQDRVSVKGDGYETLEVTVPPGGKAG